MKKGYIKRTYTVTVECPEDVGASDMRSYIVDAVEAWGWQFEPPTQENGYAGHPLFPGVQCKVKYGKREGK
jgi:hypothetical protein